MAAAVLGELNAYRAVLEHMHMVEAMEQQRLDARLHMRKPRRRKAKR